MNQSKCEWGSVSVCRVNGIRVEIRENTQRQGDTPCSHWTLFVFISNKNHIDFHFSYWVSCNSLGKRWMQWFSQLFTQAIRYGNSSGYSAAKTILSNWLFIFPEPNSVSESHLYAAQCATIRNANANNCVWFNIFLFVSFIFSSNQHYQHHPQQRTNSGSGGGAGLQHSMHTNRQSYHNGQMASNGGKGPYQYHTNAPTMNGRVAMIHKPSHMESHHHPNEIAETVEPVVVASEEIRYEEMQIDDRLSECPNATDESGAKPPPKNKTAMCLINELVRSNKVRLSDARERKRKNPIQYIQFVFWQLSHQYRVCGESGLPHEKVYTVCLELGEEKYTASGTTIKMAQQAAATKALLETKHKRPPIRQTRSTFLRKTSADRPGKRSFRKI